MTDFSIELSAERIYDKRTQDYFREVLSSFINGNYRSATVMLWSVVVSDLVYKLQALRDIYQDQVATSILESIEKKQLLNPNGPDWEPFLLDEVNTRMHLLDVADYQHLLNLLKLRHLSAHPVLGSGNLLFSPNKETTRSLIRNALEAVLLKPPIFSKKIVSEFIHDISSKKELLASRADLKKYLDAKYFKSLHIAVENELIKALWKFSFRLSNADTDLNREINVNSLYLLYQRNSSGFRNYVSQNAEYFSEISAGGNPIDALIIFLAECPALFGALTNAAQVPLRNYAKNDINLFSAASYLSDSFKAHADDLLQQPYEQIKNIDDKSWKILISNGHSEACINKVFAIGIKIYCCSGVFDTADSNFARFVEPHLSEYDSGCLIQLLDGIEKNNQTYWRSRSKIDHLHVANRVKTVGGIDLTKYPNFYGSLPD